MDSDYQQQCDRLDAQGQHQYHHHHHHHHQQQQQQQVGRAGEKSIKVSHDDGKSSAATSCDVIQRDNDVISPSLRHCRSDPSRPPVYIHRPFEPDVIKDYSPRRAPPVMPEERRRGHGCWQLHQSGGGSLMDELGSSGWWRRLDAVQVQVDDEVVSSAGSGCETPPPADVLHHASQHQDHTAPPRVLMSTNCSSSQSQQHYQHQHDNKPRTFYSQPPIKLTRFV